MKRVKIENLKLYSDSDEQDVIFNNGQEALLSLIYLKTGLIFLKPDKGTHLLFPDNMREYQNLMLMLKNLESVVDIKGAIVGPKPLLKKNVNVFKHYFLDTWVMQNLSKKHREDLMQFMAEPVESKNKLLHFKLMKYVEEMQESIPKTLVPEGSSVINDNYKVNKDTPSYNVSLANIFEAMNQLDMQKEYQNMLGAIGIAYSIVSFELIYTTTGNEGIHTLFNGKVMEFSYVENRTYGLYNKDKSKGANIPLNLETLEVNLSSGMIALKELNKEIRKDLRTWEKIEKNADDTIIATKLARIISLVFAYLFIYNGYHATTVKGDGTTLGKKFYERAVYFKQGLYTFAPSGFFYKVLNLRRLMEITLHEKIKNDLEIDIDGVVNFVDEDEAADVDEQMIYGPVDKVIFTLLSAEKMESILGSASNEIDQEFIKAWILLIQVEKREILPYSSFEFLKEISDQLVETSISKYRKNPDKSIERYKKVYKKLEDKDPQSLKGQTGFYAGLEQTYKELKSNNATSICSESILNSYFENFLITRSIFELLTHYQFNIEVIKTVLEPAVISTGIERVRKIVSELTALSTSIAKKISLNKILDTLELLKELILKCEQSDEIKDLFSKDGFNLLQETKACFEDDSLIKEAKQKKLTFLNELIKVINIGLDEVDSIRTSSEAPTVEPTAESAEIQAPVTAPAPQNDSSSEEEKSQSPDKEKQ